MSREQSDTGTRQNLMHALDRLALGFESADPHIRHEAKMVALQNFRGLAERIQENTDDR